MKLPFTLLTFLLINSGLSTAQNASVRSISLRPDLSMSPQRRLFGIDSVIDARLDTINLLGSLQFPTGEITELRFKEGFQPSLTNFIRTSLPNSDNKLPYYTLTIQELTLIGTPETIRFELAVTFLRSANSPQNVATADVGKDTKPVAPVYKADIIVESSSTTIVGVLKQGMTKAFLKFNEYLANPGIQPPVYSDFALESAKAAKELNLERITYDSTRSDDDNLLRCSQLRPGVYQNFSELRQNRPSLTGTLRIEEKDDFASLRKPSGSQIKHRFFGFSNGTDLFLSTRSYQSGGSNRRYAKVKSIGHYLLWIDNYVTSAEIARSSWGAAAFGLIGGLAAAATASYKDCIVLDMQTGGVFMATKDKLPEMLADHPDLLEEFKTLPKPKDGLQHFRLLNTLNQRNRPVVTR